MDHMVRNTLGFFTLPGRSDPTTHPSKQTVCQTVARPVLIDYRESS
jgi:hypothetical protein